MIENGAKSTFDIWYECDKPLYADDKIFSNLLDYVRTIDTQNDF